MNMERLTKYEPCEGGIPLVTVEDEQSALQRLAAYEDADEQGLLVRLPCKVGDTVWFISKWDWDEDFNIPRLYVITNYIITENKKGKQTRKYRAMKLRNGMTTSRSIEFSFCDIGKTVFLSREEAEAALKEG